MARKPIDELRTMMAEHQLTQAAVAELAEVSPKTVESWMSAPDAAMHRDMAARHLSLIRAMLPGYLAARKRRK